MHKLFHIALNMWCRISIPCNDEKTKKEKHAYSFGIRGVYSLVGSGRVGGVKGKKYLKKNASPRYVDLVKGGKKEARIDRSVSFLGRVGPRADKMAEFRLRNIREKKKFAACVVRPGPSRRDFYSSRQGEIWSGFL